MIYQISVTVTLPNKPKSEVVTSAIKGRKDKEDAVCHMLDGLFTRKGITIWYRDFSRHSFRKGYQKPDRRLLMSAVRSDIQEHPNKMEFPTNWTHGTIKIEEFPDASPIKEKPKQLSLFAFGTKYVPTPKATKIWETNDIQVIGMDGRKLNVEWFVGPAPTIRKGEDVELPYGKLDKNQLRDLGKGKKPKPRIAYVLFLRVFSPKGYDVLEGMKSGSGTPEDNDKWQQFVDQLRKEDAWILSNEASIIAPPSNAVLKEIKVADIRGLSASTRSVEAYVAGDVAYVDSSKAFVGAPPPPVPGQGAPGGPM